MSKSKVSQDCFKHLDSCGIMDEYELNAEQDNVDNISHWWIEDTPDDEDPTHEYCWLGIDSKSLDYEFLRDLAEEVDVTRVRVYGDVIRTEIKMKN